MVRRTLIDVFDDLALIHSDFIVQDDGYRSWTWTYAQVAGAARSFAARLESAGIGADDKVVIWSENSAEWIAVLWGCVLRGVVAVPVDYRSPSDLVLRISDIVDARAIVVGETVPSPQATRPVWPIRSVAPRAAATAPRAPSSASVTADSVAEIIFTSGATAEPRGVVLTHKNILANIIPIEREIAKYRRYLKLVAPIRFLNLLPLSHMFGQSLATFVPPMLPGIVVFSRSLSPHEILRQIRERHVSVVVCVPKVLEVLRDHVLVRTTGLNVERPHLHPLVRWWRYRAVHRMFGFKFWAFVVGAAPLDPELEAFWRGLGFLVIQGYGLTETAPVVTLNHPLGGASGSVGKPIAGVEIRIADDGEILVRGDNVTTGYYNAPDETRVAFKDGWFHTGDIGELDAGGQLRIRGRKKEMIVTPDGLNVYPDDVERVLNGLAGVRESAVVGAPVGRSSGERVHAVVVLEAGHDIEEVVRRANAVLADHQRIRGAAVWTAGALPRTEGTRKLRRRELKGWLTGQAAGAHPTGASGAAQVVARFAPGRELEPDTTIEGLGLSSLERIELMMALEETFQVTVDEASFAAAQTIRDLDTLVQPLTASMPAGAKPVPDSAGDFPTWTRRAPARLVRRFSLATWILPATRIFMHTRVRGLEHLQNIDGPVIFAANHQSHLDTLAILDVLPPRWRYRIAPAMLKEFFTAHFHPEQFTVRERFTSSANYYLASLFFNAFPLPQRELGARDALRYIGGIVDRGDSILIFPEGKRTDYGEIIRFQSGVGMMASRLALPVVPVRLSGLDRILHHTWTRPKRGRAEVVFGPPMWLAGKDYAQLAAQVEAAVRHLEVAS
ncbi:MAG: AMP-binding protein [Acidobacteria bacterium]|nr:AMP-binding protein [Acidobacteriota bacterium]